MEEVQVHVADIFSDSERKDCYMPIYKEFFDVPIEELETGIRIHHALKRAGFNTIGDLAEALLADDTSLSRIRNLSGNAVRVLLMELFLFQYEALSSEGKEHSYVRDFAKGFFPDRRRGG